MTDAELEAAMLAAWDDAGADPAVYRVLLNERGLFVSENPRSLGVRRTGLQAPIVPPA